MSGQTIREKGHNADYVLGLIDGENVLSTNINDYSKSFRYGIPENAKGLDYFKKAKKGNLVLGYKTIMYRDMEVEGVEWKDRPRYWCKNNGIFAVFRVESGFGPCHDKDSYSDYPNTIVLSKPLFLLENPIVFQDLKTLIPESEYVKDYRRSVTRFSKSQAKKIFDMMGEKNPQITEKIKKIF